MAPKATPPSSTTSTCCRIDNNINNDHSEYSETYNTGNLSDSETSTLLIMENDFVQKMKSPSNENVLNFAFFSFFGFTIFQFVFALMAKSQSLITDCAAQTVDCLTYLINCVAERLKNRPDTPYEISTLSQSDRDKRRKLRILILELFPPLISCTILLIVTIQSLSSAFDSILREREVTAGDGIVEDDPEDDPNLNIMLLFSGINLVLDVVSVTCFANASQFGIFLLPEPPTITSTSTSTNATTTDTTTTLTTTTTTATTAQQTQNDTKTKSSTNHPDENTALLTIDINDDLEEGSTVATTDDSSMTDHSHDLNLNMCSAFTHIMADTLRSIAVLIAAGISFFFPSLLSASDADSYGAVVVSIIIMLSVIPLIQGLFVTASQIIQLLLQNYYQEQQQHQHHQQQQQYRTTKQKNKTCNDSKTTNTIYSSCC